VNAWESAWWRRGTPANPTLSISQFLKENNVSPCASILKHFGARLARAWTETHTDFELPRSTRRIGGSPRQVAQYFTADRELMHQVLEELRM